MKNMATDSRKPDGHATLVGSVEVTASKSATAVADDRDKIKEISRLERDRILFWGS